MGGGKEVCQVCKIPSTLKCTKCNVAVYCSRDHQKQDWKAHKKECWPLAEGFDDEYGGRYWVASRDIPEGYIILKECPAISGPHLPSTDATPKGEQLDLYTEEQQAQAKWDHVCLGCSTLLTEETKKLCSKCGWPVCGPECEEIAIHSQNECPFFAQRRIKYPIQDLPPHIASFGIHIVRGMFLHERDPVLCNKLINNLQDARPGTPRGPETYCEEQMSRYLQFRAAFKIRHFHQDEVWTQLFEVLPTTCISDCRKLEGKESQELSVFPVTAKFNRHCVGNASETTRRLNSTANLTGSNLQIQIRALRPISKGDSITLKFRHSSLDYGTEERFDHRHKLARSVCVCERCWDPTELGTFCSAIKCRTCSTGYMLPERFIKLHAPFICSNCPGKQMGRRRVKKLIYQLFQEVLASEKLVIDDAGDGLDGEDGEFGEDGKFGEDGMKNLKKFIGKHSGKTLHPNHWILQRVMVRFCFALAPAFAKNPANIERAIVYGRKLIDLTQMITPGLVLEKIQLMLRTAEYASLDLKNKISSLSEEDVKKRCAEIHEWASAVLKFWEQEMAEEPGAVTIESKSIENITEDMTVARNLIEEAEEVILNNGSSVHSVDGGKFQQLSISGDSKT